jgi:hypothetical protein
VKLLVGCPVAQRQWILPTWFNHVRTAADVAGIEPAFVFVVHPQDRSWNCILEHAPDATLIEPPFNRGNDVRTWTPQRYVQMVTLRNLLLAGVRAQAATCSCPSTRTFCCIPTSSST